MQIIKDSGKTYIDGHGIHMLELLVDSTHGPKFNWLHKYVEAVEGKHDRMCANKAGLVKRSCVRYRFPSAKMMLSSDSFYLIRSVGIRHKANSE